MSATHKLTQKNKDVRVPLLSLSLCAALLLAFSQVTHAQDPSSESSNGLGQGKVQFLIDSTALQSSSASPVSWHKSNNSSNISVIAQSGNDNQARVDQMHNKNYVYGNYANIYQNGNRNEANIIQSGGNNIGLIGQIGNANQATIEQSGNSFEAQVNQYGYKSEINISQSGSAQRSISVSQRSNSGAAAPVTIRTY